MNPLVLLAEGARFELADPLRGLQFSRLARSAAPSPLQTELVQPGALIIQARRDICHKLFFDSCLSLRPKPTTVPGLWRWDLCISILLFANLLKPAHIVTQYRRDCDAPIRLLVVFEDGQEGAADGQPGPVESVDKLCFRALLSNWALISNIGPPSLKSFKVAARGDLPIVALGRKPDFDVIGLCRGESHIAGTEGDNSVVKF